MSLRRGQAGMTLVEIMVALLLGLFITAGVLRVFQSNRVTYSFNEGLARLQENGRFAVDTLNHRVRMAGYRGCLSGVVVTNNLGSTALGFDFENGLTGFEADDTGPGDTFAATAKNPGNSSAPADWTPTLSAELQDRVVPGSDVLVVRNMSAGAHALVSPFNDSAQIFAEAETTDYAIGDIGIVSDCQKASVFQITGVTSSGPSRIDVDHGGGATPGNAATSWGSDQGYGDGAELMLGETWVFYVGAPDDGGPPALFQQRLQVDSSGPSVQLVDEELIESVDTMQVMYGVDAGLGGEVDNYVTADAVADWGDVVAVRISLLVRSPEEYGTEIDDQTYDVNETTFNPLDDRRVRQVFTTTVALRNRLP